MTNDTPPESNEIRIDLGRELVDLLIIVARTFEALPAKEAMKLQRMLERPHIVRKNAATVAELAMGCGFIFAMQLREMQKAKMGESIDGEHTEAG